MTQEAIVYSVDDRGRALVEVTRRSACGGDCGSCGGCSHPEQLIRVTALNTAGASAGDRVTIETSARRVFTAAYIAYILPVMLMIGAYFIPVGGEGARILSSFAGFGLGIVICRAYSRRLGKKGDIRAEITAIIRG